MPLASASVLFRRAFARERRYEPMPAPPHPSPPHPSRLALLRHVALCHPGAKLRRHAVRCYGISLQMYSGVGWTHVEGHLREALQRQSKARRTEPDPQPTRMDAKPANGRRALAGRSPGTRGPSAGHTLTIAGYRRVSPPGIPATLTPRRHSPRARLFLPREARC